MMLSTLPRRALSKLDRSLLYPKILSADTASGPELKSFLVCLMITILIAGLRIAYCMTIPTPFDWDAVEVAMVLSGIAGLCSVVPVAKLTPLGTILRCVGILLLAKIGLIETVVMIYWSGRTHQMADGVLAQLDSVLGFDWNAYVGLVNAHPILVAPLHAAYVSIWWQPMVVGLLTAWIGQVRRTYVMVCAKGVSIFLISCVTYFVPAYGAYTFFGASLTTFPYIRDGDLGQMKMPLDKLRAGMFDAGQYAVPLVQFPSFHATEVVLMTWAAWRTPFRVPITLLNIAMLAATPVFGSHYFADLVAGAAIGALTIFGIDALIAAASRVSVPDLVSWRPRSTKQAEST